MKIRLQLKTFAKIALEPRSGGKEMNWQQARVEGLEPSFCCAAGGRRCARGAQSLGS